MNLYQIEIQTGTIDNAGTHANVYIQLLGEHTHGREIRLEGASNCFEKGNLATFTIETESIGWLDRVRIFHDSTGEKPSWHPSFIRITEIAKGIIWKADINRWLTNEDGDKQTDITVEIPAGNIQLSEGFLKSIYLGYKKLSYSNQGQSSISIADKFGFTYAKGVTVDTSSAVLSANKTPLEEGFFCKDGKFHQYVTKEITNTLNTSRQETFSVDINFSYELLSGRSITPTYLFFQSELDGKVQVGNITLDYCQKFLVTYQLIILEGYLSDDQVEAHIQELFSINTQSIVDSEGLSEDRKVVMQKMHLKVVEPYFIHDTIQKIPVGFPAIKPVKAEKGIIEISPINTHASFESVKIS